MYIYINMSTPTKRYHKHLEENETPTYSYGRCKNCGFRIIHHSINESFQCKLISKKLYKKFIKPAPDEAWISLVAPNKNLLYLAK